MRFLRHITRSIIHLDTRSPLHIGGEGRIYAVAETPDLVAKIYNPECLTKARIRKLCVMIGYPPENRAVAVEHHVPIAWPLDLLRSADDGHRVVGFLMPKVEGMWPVSEFYNPRARRGRFPRFNTRYLHRTARNLAAAIHMLHTAGYVVGDISESNIFVSSTAKVTLVDTDSFQVVDPDTNTPHRCEVGRPEFTPPELQGVDLGQVDRTPEQDHFGLAVLVFQLLMEGTHPFEGIYKGTGDPPAYAQRIVAGHFPYGSGENIPYRPKPGAPSFQVLSPPLQKLFIRCFEEGRNDPLSRPDARTWQTALAQAEYGLSVCPDNAQHWYGSHCDHCPWCTRSAELGLRDPFPSDEVLEVQIPRLPHRQMPPPRIRVSIPPAAALPTFSPSPSLHESSSNGLSLSTLMHIPYAGGITIALTTLILLLLAGLHPALWLGLLAAGCGIVGWHRTLTGFRTSMAWTALTLSGATLLLFLLSDW